MAARSPAAHDSAALLTQAAAVGSSSSMLELGVLSRRLQVSDAEVNIANFFLQDESATTTDASATDYVNALPGGDAIDRRKLPQRRIATAAVLLEHERQAWAQLENLIVKGVSENSDAKLHVYMEAGAYDGVDLRLKTKSNSAAAMVPAVTDGDAGLLSLRDADAEDGESSLAVPKLDWNAGLDLHHASGRCKVLQSEYHQVMTYFVGENYYIIVGNQLCPLQVSNRTTGEAMTGLLQQHAVGIENHSDFPRPIRNVCTDRYIPNKIAEAQLLMKRPNISLCHIDCHAHILASGLSSVQPLAKNDLPGLKCYLNTLNAPGESRKHEDSAFKALSSILEIVDASSPEAVVTEDSAAYKTFVLDTFIPSVSEDSNHVRYLLLKCGPVDWRAEKFVFPVQYGETRAQVLTFLRKYFIKPLFGHAPFKYPDGKWTGSEKSFKDSCLPASICKLTHLCWAHYMLSYYPDDIPADVKRKMVGLGGRMLAIFDWNLPVAAEVDDGVALPIIGYSTMNWQKYNKGQRGGAHKWLATYSWLFIMVFPMLVVPFSVYLATELKNAANSFASSQFKKPIASATNGVQDLLGDCKWPLLQLASGVADEKFKSSMLLLSRQEAYGSLPGCIFTVASRHWIFKMLSRQHAYFHEYLELPHTLPPYSVFDLLRDSSNAGVRAEHLVRTLCRKLMDPYTLSFVEYYEKLDGGILGLAALLELALIVIFGRSNTERIESINALLRRMLNNRYQNSNMFVRDLGAKYLLNRSRLRRLNINALTRKDRKASLFKTRVDKRVIKRKANKRGGGAWRAFVRERCKGIAKAMFHELVIAYHNLSQEELEPYKKLGALATAAHRRGGASFGLTTRAMGRLAHNSSVWQRLASRAFNPRRGNAAEVLVVVGSSM